MASSEEKWKHHWVESHNSLDRFASAGSGIGDDWWSVEGKCCCCCCCIGKQGSSCSFLLCDTFVFVSTAPPLSMKSLSLSTSDSFTGFTRNSSAPSSKHLENYIILKEIKNMHALINPTNPTNHSHVLINLHWIN